MTSVLQRNKCSAQTDFQCIGFGKIVKQKRKFFVKCVQREKKKFWNKKQDEIDSICQDDNREFWKSNGRIGIGDERKKSIPVEVSNTDGTVSRDLNAVLNKWKTDFSHLLNPQVSDKHGSRVDHNMNINSYSDDGLNNGILALEAAEAMRSMKNNKAYGVDELPAEVIKNDNFIHLLTVLFKESGMTPEIWKRGIIQPVPKPLTMDSRDPLSDRGITLTPVVYKMYGYQCGFSKMVSFVTIKTVSGKEGAVQTRYPH